MMPGSRRQLDAILEMYDEGELTLESLFETWEGLEPPALVYGSTEYRAYEAGQREIGLDAAALHRAMLSPGFWIPL